MNIQTTINKFRTNCESAKSGNDVKREINIFAKIAKLLDVNVKELLNDTQKDK